MTDDLAVGDMVVILHRACGRCGFVHSNVGHVGVIVETVVASFCCFNCKMTISRDVRLYRVSGCGGWGGRSELRKIPPAQSKEFALRDAKVLA